MIMASTPSRKAPMRPLVIFGPPLFDNITSEESKRQLVQERFPVGWHPSCRSRRRLIFRMRVRRKQLHTLDHPLLLVIEEPLLTRFEAGNDRMPCRCRMPGCMLARGTVAASDVPTLRAPAEVKPPTFRGRQTFHTPIATRFRSGVDSALIFLHPVSLTFLLSAKRISSHQQDLPDTTLFRRGLSFGCLAQWQLAADRNDQFAISREFSYRVWRPCDPQFI
jgi:hypothetical protein